MHVADDFIIADKPSGLLSVPGIGPEKAVCANSVLSERHGPVLTVHRLDMDTSGLMVFARTKDAQRALSRQFELRAVDKTYEALVEGEMESEAGTIDAPIAKYSLKRPLRHLDPDGQTAITHWRVLERQPGQTRVWLKPETGRSHQLRVHCLAIGHPILGDPLYAEGAAGAPKMLSIGLHCRLVGRPGRAAALKRAIDYTLSRPGLFLNTTSDASLLDAIFAAARETVNAPDPLALDADAVSLGVEPLFVRDVSDDVLLKEA